MGNLRPAPVELTPQRVDSLIRAIDHYDGVPQLAAIGLTPAEISSVRRIARRRGISSVEAAATMLRAALEAVEAHR